MSGIIEDGTGTGNTAKVSGNKLFTHSISEPENIHSTEQGDSYNINSGLIALTSGTASSVLYLKNNELRDIVIEAVAIGVSSGGTTSDVSYIEIVRNPTSVDYSTAVPINQNRNFGSSKVISVDTYIGAEGSTSTGGDVVLLFQSSAGNRLFASTNMVLTSGSSVAINVNTNTTSGTTNVYAAIVCYIKDETLEG